MNAHAHRTQDAERSWNAYAAMRRFQAADPKLQACPFYEMQCVASHARFAATYSAMEPA